MELFYCPELTRTSTRITLSREESHHLRRVFRKKSGESILLCNGAGLSAIARISAEGPAQTTICEVDPPQYLAPPPERNIHMAISVIRPNRLDWAIEKLTEMGIGAIHLLTTQYTSIKGCKLAHLNKIAISAMKQSRQFFLPALISPSPFPEWLKQLPAGKPTCLIAHLNDAALPLRQQALSEAAPIFVAIGPEGGFSEAEILLAREYGFAPLKLAREILRSETAAITAAAQIKLKFL